jgi:hypothetical protein
MCCHNPGGLATTPAALPQPWQPCHNPGGLAFHPVKAELKSKAPRLNSENNAKPVQCRQTRRKIKTYCHMFLSIILAWSVNRQFDEF